MERIREGLDCLDGLEALDGLEGLDFAFAFSFEASEGLDGYEGVRDFRPLDVLDGFDRFQPVRIVVESTKLNSKFLYGFSTPYLSRISSTGHSSSFWSNFHFDFTHFLPFPFPHLSNEHKYNYRNDGEQDQSRRNIDQ